MKTYLDALKYIMDNGVDRDDRTGTGTRSVFTYQMRFNLQDGFPAVTTKRLAVRAMASELLWFIEGSSDERRLCEILHGTRDEEKKTIWTDNANADYWTGAEFPGDLGRVYGVQWRNWRTPQVIHKTTDGIPSHSEITLKRTDQLAEVIQRIKDKPWDRRHIVTAWNPGELDQMALPPCHMTFQFYVAPFSYDDRKKAAETHGQVALGAFNNLYENGKTPDTESIEVFDRTFNIPKGKLSCHMFQRSCDLFLGVPFNIASYALLTHMVAQVTDLDVGELILTLGDAHIYNNHFDQVKEQLSREPDELPTLWLNPDIKNIDDFTMDDFRLENYNPQASIKAPMAV